VSNPPQFPLHDGLDEDHPRTWSDGGINGRSVLEPLLAGLAAHLAPGGVALVTHNRFVGLDRSVHRLMQQGLDVEVGPTVTVPLTDERAAMLRRGHRAWGSVERFEAEPGVICVGPQVLVEFVVLRVAQPDPAPPAIPPAIPPAA